MSNNINMDDIFGPLMIVGIALAIAWGAQGCNESNNKVRIEEEKTKQLELQLNAADESDKG